MDLKTIKTQAKTVQEAVKELKEQLNGFDFNTLIFFASYSYNAEELSNELNNNFADKNVFGCSSLSEFIDNAELKESIVAMAVNQNIFADVKVEVLENVQNELNVEQVFDNFGNYYKTPTRDMNYKDYIGLLLIDGLTMAEERIIDQIGNFTNVFFVGGSAADNLTFKNTYVYANGKAYENAAVVALIKMNTDFDFIKTQSVEKKGTSFTITKAIPDERKILEINNIPAAQYFSELFNTPIDKLEDVFFDNPIGLCIGDDIYIRSLKEVTDDGGVTTYCSIEEGLDIEWLSIKDMVSDTKKAIEEKKETLGNISGIIEFNCAFRTLQLHNNKNMNDYVKVFDYPKIGFSTYGEIYLGHMNQTATMLIIK